MAAQGVLAATLIKPGQYEIREYPLPEPAAGCVVVKMELSGICGTDKHTFQFDAGSETERCMPRTSYLVNPLEAIQTPTTSVSLSPPKPGETLH